MSARPNRPEGAGAIRAVIWGAALTLAVLVGLGLWGWA